MAREGERDERGRLKPLACASLSPSFSSSAREKEEIEKRGGIREREEREREEREKREERREKQLLVNRVFSVFAESKKQASRKANLFTLSLSLCLSFQRSRKKTSLAKKKREMGDKKKKN